MAKIMNEEKRKEMRNKGKGFIGEFKDFVMRGSVMDMAIGIIIGTAFSGLVTAFTSDFINPLINGLGGAEVGGSIKIYGGQSILYGDFITAVLNFLIMAFVLFLLLKLFNNIKNMGAKKNEEVEITKSEEVQLLEEIRDLLKKNK